MLESTLGLAVAVAIWALIATAALATILSGSQYLGFSRLSLPLLMGSYVTGNRYRAMVWGFFLYLLGGWIFALGYWLVFLSVGFATWWFGAALGFFHGLVLLGFVLPVLPYIHPRIASEYEGPTRLRRLEPPGFMGFNYGRRTPLTTLLGHTVYGLILGACYPIPG